MFPHVRGQVVRCQVVWDRYLTDADFTFNDRDSLMTDRLTGKTAFVTAAGQGIGRAVVQAFVREGARVIATDINEELLAALKDDLQADFSKPGGCTTQRLDVTDPAAISAAAAAHGPVNVLFNGAG